jgi:hypothetical protein
MKTRRNRKAQKGGMTQKPVLQNIEEKNNNQFMKQLIRYMNFSKKTGYDPLAHLRNKKAEGSYFPVNNKGFAPNNTRTKRAKYSNNNKK